MFCVPLHNIIAEFCQTELGKPERHLFFILIWPLNKTGSPFYAAVKSAFGIFKLNIFPILTTADADLGGKMGASSETNRFETVEPAMKTNKF